jgi:hypothetical protein
VLLDATVTLQVAHVVLYYNTLHMYSTPSNSIPEGSRPNMVLQYSLYSTPAASTIQFSPTRPTRIPSLGCNDSDTKCNAPGSTHGLGPLCRGVSPTCVANSLAFSSSLRAKRLIECYYIFLPWLFKLVWPYLRF